MRKIAGIYKEAGNQVIEDVRKEFGVDLGVQQAEELREVLHDTKITMGGRAERFTDFDWAEIVFNFLKGKGLLDLSKGDSWTNYVQGSLKKESVGGVAYGKTVGNDVKKLFGVELDQRGIEELTQVISRKLEYFKSSNRPFTKVEWMETAFEYLKDNGLVEKEHWIDYIKGSLDKKASESGKHFGDFLKTHSVDCDIIIGGAEMPAGFVWDKDDMGFTEEGQKQFAEILNAPYEVYDNGNIEVKSKSWQLGEYFVSALAGEVSTAAWNEWFVDKMNVSSGSAKEAEQKDFNSVVSRIQKMVVENSVSLEEVLDSIYTSAADGNTEMQALVREIHKYGLENIREKINSMEVKSYLLKGDVPNQDELKDIIETIVDDYNQQFKVEDTSSPSAPDTSKFMATSGGWARVRNKGEEYVLEIGTSFPKAKELIAELESSIPNMTVRERSQGTNYNTYIFLIKAQDLDGESGHKVINAEDIGGLHDFHEVEEYCPNCKTKMSMGASHQDTGGLQWECHKCGYTREAVMQKETARNFKVGDEVSYFIGDVRYEGRISGIETHNGKEFATMDNGDTANLDYAVSGMELVKASLQKKSDTNIHIENLTVDNGSSVKFKEMPELSKGVNLNVEREEEEEPKGEKREELEQKVEENKEKDLGKEAAQPFMKDEEAIRNRLKVLYRILKRDNNFADRSEAETLEKKLQELKKKDLEGEKKAAIQKESDGDETFGEYLKGHTLDCDLILAGAETPASFVWDTSVIDFTEEGRKQFSEILDSPFKVLENGNIEVFSKDWKLGVLFVEAAAGLIGDQLYKIWFEEKDLEKESSNGDRPWEQTDTDIKREVNMNVADVPGKDAAKKENLPEIITILVNGIEYLIEDEDIQTNKKKGETAEQTKKRILKGLPKDLEVELVLGEEDIGTKQELQDWLDQELADRISDETGWLIEMFGYDLMPDPLEKKESSMDIQSKDGAKVFEKGDWVAFENPRWDPSKGNENRTRVDEGTIFKVNKEKTPVTYEVNYINQEGDYKTIVLEEQDLMKIERSKESSMDIQTLEKNEVVNLVKKSKKFNCGDLDKKPSWKLETAKDGKKQIVKINSMDPAVLRIVENNGLRYKDGQNVFMTTSGSTAEPVSVVKYAGDNQYIVADAAGYKRQVDKNLLFEGVE